MTVASYFFGAKRGQTQLITLVQNASIPFWAESSLGSPFQIQRKSQRVLELLHDPCGKPANLALKAHGRQRSQSLHIGY